jgi:hypothetical protein
MVVYRVLQGIHTARLDEALTDSCAPTC